MDRGADYKENQGRLYQDVRDLFGGAEELGWDGVPYDYATTLNKGQRVLATTRPLMRKMREGGGPPGPGASARSGLLEHGTRTLAATCPGCRHPGPPGCRRDRQSGMALAPA